MPSVRADVQRQPVTWHGRLPSHFLTGGAHSQAQQAPCPPSRPQNVLTLDGRNRFHLDQEVLFHKAINYQQGIRWIRFFPEEAWK
jgi:hypothetical protein